MLNGKYLKKIFPSSIFFLVSFFGFFGMQNVFAFDEDKFIEDFVKSCLEEYVAKPHLKIDGVDPEYKCSENAEKKLKAEQLKQEREDRIAEAAASGDCHSLISEGRRDLYDECDERRDSQANNSNESDTQTTTVTNTSSTAAVTKKTSAELKEICKRNLKENAGLVGYDGGICKGIAGGNEESGFEVITSLIQRLLNWIIGIAYLIAVMAIFFAGIKLLTANGNPTGMSEAKKILWSVLKGLFFITAAWMLVDFIFNLFIKGNDINKYKFTNQNQVENK